MNEVVSDVINFDSNFKSYPSPVVSELYIETTEDRNSIFIYSLQGVLLKKIIINTTNTKIDVNDLSSGVYILELLNQKGKFQKKIIIK